MTFLLRLLRICWGISWYLFAIFIVTIAAALAIARLMLPLAVDYKTTVEQNISEFMNLPVSIKSMDAEVHGFGPWIVLNDVTLYRKDGKSTLMKIPKVSVGMEVFDIIASLLHWDIVSSRLALSLDSIFLERQEDGKVVLLRLDQLSDSKPGAETENFLSTWLFGQTRLKVDIKHLLFRDRLNKQRPKLHFTNVSVLLRNDGERHLIDGVLGLPSDPKHEMSVSMEISGNPLVASTEWNGDIYISGHQIDFGQLIGAQKVMSRKVSLGSSDFEIWSKWNNGNLKNIRGEFSLNKLFISSKKKLSKSQSRAESVKFRKLGARFSYHRTTEGWHLEADRVKVLSNGKRWPSGKFYVDYNKNLTGQYDIEAAASFVRLQDLVPLINVYKEKHKEFNDVSQLNPSGDIKRLYVKWNDQLKDRLLLSAKLENVGFSSYRKIPGVKNLTATIKASEFSGKGSLETKNASVDFPNLFRNKLDIQRLNGEFGWAFRDGLWQLNAPDLKLANADISTQNFVSLQWDEKDKTPFLELVSKFYRGNGSQIPKYLPANIMSKKAVKWLDQSIISGNVTTGTALFRGQLNKFPFKSKEGVFEVRFNVKNGVLNYVNEWPVIRDINAEVIFNGTSLDVKAKRSNVFSNRLNDVLVSSGDLSQNPMQLNIAGEVQGITQDKINYIVKSPALHDLFGKYFADVKATGESNLDLKIDLNLGEEIVPTVTGELQLKNNKFDYASVENLLSNVTGKISILPKGLKSDVINADLLGQASRIKISTLKPKTANGNDRIRISSRGDFDASNLSQRHFPVFADLLSGKSRWDVRVDIPLVNEQSSNRSEAASLQVKTNLNGIEIRLPQPFTKSRFRSQQLQSKISFLPDDKYLLNLRYGRLINSITEFNAATDKTSVRGELRFGGGAVSLPVGTGMRLSGKLDKFSVDIWRTLISQFELKLKQSKSSGVVVSGAATKTSQPEVTQARTQGLHMDYLHSADMTVDDFELLGQRASNISLSVKKNADRLNASVRSKQLQGFINVPKSLDHDPVHLDLDYWHLKASTEESGQLVDPRHLPAMDLNCKQVTYNGKKFGSVALKTTKVTEGIRLEQLTVKPRDTTITARGKWFVERGQQQSQFKFRLESNDLGKVMRDLNYAESIRDAKGVVNADLSWPGALTTVNMPHMYGTASLEFQDGRLLMLDPGQGKLLGLFSIQTLPRLFTGNSDVVSKGLGFDEIKGAFKIQDGDAYINSFYLDGETARVELSGRIGIAAQDYDQKLIITPNIAGVTSTLSLLSGDPLLFLLQQLLKDGINRVSRVEYSLTGPWDNFKLEQIVEEETEDDVLE